MMIPAQPPEERDAAIGREFEDRVYKGHAFKAHEKDSTPGTNPVLEQERERLALKGILKNSVRCVGSICCADTMTKHYLYSVSSRGVDEMLSYQNRRGCILWAVCLRMVVEVLTGWLCVREMQDQMMEKELRDLRKLDAGGWNVGTVSFRRCAQSSIDI